jgi:hypothetical protein
MTVAHEQDEFEVEEERLPAGPVTGVVIAIAAIVMMIVTLAVNITTLKFEEARKTSIAHTGYPLLESTRTAADAKLSQTGAVAGEEGVYQIPIDQAMKLVVDDAASN